MRATVASLRALAGDALIAAGEAVRGGLPNVDVWPPMSGRIGVMESDGPGLTQPLPLDEIRGALADLPDSHLLNIAASVISTWVPLTDHLASALRDRADQFAVLERDADEPFLTPADLHGPK